ncbi:DUF3261 domain-containing protein [Colwellia sp. MSW7]|uniref:DUF3261 domain-containing protein n=1 Tax=Colwellia maritima TaxID=2912588 RepID=A0ABS9WYL4_9GAMM|nr:DUF3261 domain-containing protein [Colwellia maritima]MCI2282627.1 DUF3261 domain-containing protein [Colwellia maritima]
MLSCSSTYINAQNQSFYQLQALPRSLQNKVFLETLTFQQDEQRTLLTQIETSEQSLSLGAMTFSGLPIIQAKWHSREGLVGFSSMAFDKSMIMRIIRDIQLVKWPEESINAGLLPNYRLHTIQTSANERVREIRDSEQTIVKVTYLENKIILINAIEHYQLTIEQVNE